MAGTPNFDWDDLMTSVPPACDSFKGGKGVSLVRGSKESTVYADFRSGANRTRGKDTVRNILQSVEILGNN